MCVHLDLLSKSELKLSRKNSMMMMVSKWGERSYMTTR